MTSFRPTAEQAKTVVVKIVKHGNSRFNRKLVGDKTPCISSILTEKKYMGCVKIFYDWCKKSGVPFVNIDSDVVGTFLASRVGSCVQKTIDGYRQSLALVFNLEVEYVVSTKDSLLVPRAYRTSQIDCLLDAASDELSFAIRLAAAAGLRSIELDTIAFPSEVYEDKREWLTERFEGMGLGSRYVVIGKGGLKRSIHVPNDIAVELEQFRLALPIKKTQRGVHYIKRYSIVGGHSFSQRFSRLSFSIFGWSTGGHGLRHTYAQNRIIDLQKIGFTWNDGLKIVSQELGHFSTTNTLTYMR